jgi:N-methylhydantoinase A/oxoprolinase/acetone carboxylase beta subunit
MLISIDIGGTFTDYIIIEDSEIKAFKTLTTTDPSQGIISQLGKFKENVIKEFSHGTTIAINAVLEKKGADIVFFTTKGFKDLIQIGRQARDNIYSFFCSKPKLPVKHIVEINERTLSTGEIIHKISKDEIMDKLKIYSNNASVVVIGFINSYLNPENEIKAEQILSQFFPVVISSHKIRREIREYERFCTTIIEGYCTPMVDNYLRKLEKFGKKFFVMQSNGGRSETRHLKKVNMLFSGPAGGVAATQSLCRKLGIENTIAFDMGGTSVDISAIVSGSPLYTDLVKVSGIPIKILTLDIESIGAGGGSIAWVDDGGALKVGPMSAGSDPGPACYDKGGNEFTVSDANLIMGILGDNISKVILNKDQAIEASKSLCKILNIDHQTLSQGIIKIINNNMVNALKNISIGRGYDPRKFALVAFGGAGPMHACALAETLNLKNIIIPPQAGAFSALGIISAPVRFDFIQTILKPLDNSLELIQQVIGEFEKELKNKLGREFKYAVLQTSLDMRYHGQGHEINIPLKNNIKEEFNRKHQKIFGFNTPDNPIEVINVKLVAELPPHDLPLGKFNESKPQIQSTRNVFPFGKIPIYKKAFHGYKVNGPCIIKDSTTTIFVDSNWYASLDLNGILQMESE